jgi:hypothetical protein
VTTRLGPAERMAALSALVGTELSAGGGVRVWSRRNARQFSLLLPLEWVTG